jgi:transposase
MLSTTIEYPPPDERDLEIFEATVPPHHYLRQVKAVIDFERCRAEFAACYSQALGRPAREPILLLKLEFLQFHYNLSDRQVIEQAQYNMAYRYFLGLSLASTLPHHTLLTKFRDRLGVDKHQRVFEDIVAQARERGLVKDRVRLKDATHVLANIAIPSAIHLVRQARQALLAAVRPYAPERVTDEEAHADTVRTTTADLSGAERLLQRVQHMRSIATWVEQRIADLGLGQSSEPAHQPLREALALAHKVLADKEDPKAKDKLVSVQDPDARWGRHGQIYAGFMLDVAMDADSSIITALNVLPANGDEARDATTLIQQEEQAHGNDVAALSIDGVGFRGYLLHEWTDPQGLNLEVIVPPTTEPVSVYFTAKDFTWNAAAGTVTCPAGKTTSRKQRNPNDTGWTFRFSGGHCQGCPLQGKCLETPPGKLGRAVAMNDFQADYDAARAKARTPEFAAARRQHWRIERKLGEMVRRHGARQARYRGHCKVLLQGLLTGIVVNVKRVVHLVAAQTVRAKVLASG